jgi:hypothetical protein
LAAKRQLRVAPGGLPIAEIQLAVERQGKSAMNVPITCLGQDAVQAVRGSRIGQNVQVDGEIFVRRFENQYGDHQELIEIRSKNVKRLGNAESVDPIHGG